MIEPKAIPDEELHKAVVSIPERIEQSGEYSKLFFDANILISLFQKKNQVVFGRRGTGKTHLLGTLKEYYRDKFPQKRILPIFINGKEISNIELSGGGGITKLLQC